jgi:hypothetical protein
MIDIDEYARRAVESPVAQPPDIATLEAIASRRRRDRRVRRSTLVVGFASVAVAAIVALSLIPSDSDKLNVTAQSPTAVSTTVTGSFTGGDLTIASLTDRLARDGFHVTADGTAPGYPLAAVGTLLCVDGTQLRVYQYANAAARVAVSMGISPDGSRIELPSTGNATRAIVSVDWVGPPHFFAAGRIIVLVLQDDEKVLRALSRILGPTVSPRALRLADHKSPCATTTP